MKEHYRLLCTSCGTDIPDVGVVIRCPKCGGLLEYAFEIEYLRRVDFKDPFTFWRYAPVLPKVQEMVTLGEGGTTLHSANRLGEKIGLRNFYLKDETRNPTSSFKDRVAALIISDAIGKGFESLVCATNGNQGASLSAYCAKVNMACHLVVPRDLDMGKLAQMIVYDAHLEEAGVSIEEAITRSERLVEETGWYQATTELNPLSVEALKTISIEITEQLHVPDWVIVAMGSGTTIHAIWKGFKELEEMGKIDRKPRLIGVQAIGCAPIARAFKLGVDNPIEIEKAETEAVAIKVSSPLYGQSALSILKASSGLAVSVTDEDMLAAEKEIAKMEGIFAEPASAATVACLKHLVEGGEIDKGDSVVSLITSSGLKTDDILRTLSKHRKSAGIGFSLATKEQILRTIQRKKTYGYDLWKGIGKEMTIGAIYQHISDLEKRGLITSVAEGKRRYLKLTERGGRVLHVLDELRNLL